jgi:hypothetical protein
MDFKIHLHLLQNNLNPLNLTHKHFVMKKVITLLHLLFVGFIGITQNVGIGTNTPSEKLHVYQATGNTIVAVQSLPTSNLSAFEARNASGTSDLTRFGSNMGSTIAGISANNATRLWSTDGKMIIGTGSGEHLHLVTSGLERLRLSDLGSLTLFGIGNFGMGTVDPQASIHVRRDFGYASMMLQSMSADGVSFLSLLNQDGSFEVSRYSSSTNYELVGLSSNGLANIRNTGNILLEARNLNNIFFATNNAIRLKIDSTGKVGIGISNPKVNLQVDDANLDGSILITNGISGSSIADGLRIRMNSEQGSITNNENGDLLLITNNGEDGPLGKPMVYVKPSGAVGIGTSNPNAKLEILGVGALQPALNINNGFMKVSGANKTAFTVTGNASNSATYFLYPGYANQSASDILIVTHNYNPPGVGGTYHNVPVGVFWDGIRWSIYSEDTVTPMLGKSFNVLVIKQ